MYCSKCCTPLANIKNNITALVRFNGKPTGVAYNADLKGCKTCGYEIVVGLGSPYAPSEFEMAQFLKHKDTRYLG